MTSLSDLYQYVRVQTQTQADELPDATINAYLQQAFERTIAAHNSWPFYEQTWFITQPAGSATADLPGDVVESRIITLVSPEGYRLQMVAPETALLAYGSAPSTAYPREYSLWGDKIMFWPEQSHADDRSYVLFGFRRPAAWSGLLPAESPDCDERLHLPLASYAIALAYAQQEDEVLETTYMARWQNDVEMAAKAIMEPAHRRPLTMGPHYRATKPGFPFVVNTGGL